MKGHSHELSPPLTVDSQGNGLYAATTGRLAMGGIWYAEVRVTTAGGDTVTQQFSFHQPLHAKPFSPTAAETGTEQRQ